jgi:hypothetical protein
MELFAQIDIKKLTPSIKYTDKLLLVGSCFTEHIGNSLSRWKFNVLQNPNGILFDPDSVARSIENWVDNSPVKNKQLFRLNETWNNWQYHSRFSATDLDTALSGMNESRQHAHEFARHAKWLIVTLGSAFSYRLTEKAEMAGGEAGSGVANCHRAPGDWFEKRLLDTRAIISSLENCFEKLFRLNPGIRVILTISPVRHIRDGLVDNNRSKARLIEAVHAICQQSDRFYYFPAYELVIDVLRDYRFYDIDLAHPNYAATEFVLDKFREYCLDPADYPVMEEVKKITIARRHKPFQPGTNAHRQFLETHAQKTRALQQRYPYLDLSEELKYFNGEISG